MTAIADQPLARGAFDTRRVVARAVGLLRSHGLVIAAASLIFIGGIEAATGALIRMAPPVQPAAGLFGVLRPFILLELQSLGMSLVETFASAWVALLMVQSLSAGGVSPLRAAGDLARHGLPLAVGGVLYFLGLIGGAILLLVPALMLMAAWSVAVPALVVENLSPVRAFRRSLELTRGSRWPIFGLACLVGVTAGLLNLILAKLISPGASLTAALVSPMAKLVELPLLTAAEHVFIAVGTASIYVELATLKDGVMRSQLDDVFS